MATTSRRPRTPPRALLLAVLITCCLPVAAGAVLQPLDARGDFPASVDVVNRWRGEDRLDVMVLVEVVNGDLFFTDEAGGLVARLRIEVELEALDGRVVKEKRPVRTAAIDSETAGSRTEFQIFGLLLEDVPFRQGRVRCRIYDVRAHKEGLLNEIRGSMRVCAAAGLWSAPERARPDAGLALEDPLFLAHAPLMEWRPGAGAANDGRLLHDYVHPARRYGLEQERLQLFMPIWPRAGGVPADVSGAGLLVQVANQDLDFALTDTVGIDATGRAALLAGRPAALIYELDVNLLPEGPYLLSVGPLAGRGRGVVKHFDVVWRLAALARDRRQLLGEGRTVLYGRAREEFLAASATEQELILKEFWERHDPDPANPVNETYLEFQYRLAYVRQFLGGFDEFGARDARGDVFLALGPPDEVSRKRMPQNFRDQDDARIKVYNRFAPDREGTMVRGNTGSASPSPYSQDDFIPQPFSRRAENMRDTSQRSSTHLQAFELWQYDRGGRSLWDNRFTATGMGQRFLFIDRTGTGQFFLESSNVVQGEE